jgi:hypothetical protein
MEEQASSPKVTHLSWGRLEVGGRSFKDAKLFPGGARTWDWNETGTRHDPGIQSADVEELLERGATAVVLSKGFHERLGVSPQTGEAIQLYNRLRATERVGALIHSTC